MMKLIRVAVSAMVLFGLASTASAGTKWQTNLVPVPIPGEDPAVKKMTVKSKIKMTDKGIIQVKLDGVTSDGTDAGRVTTDGSLEAGSVSGDEYVVVLKGRFPPLAYIRFEINLIVEVKGGKAKGKLDGSGLFGPIAGLANRAVELGVAEVWGPIGDQVCAFNADLAVDTCQGRAACTTNADCPTFDPGNACEGNLAIGFVLPDAPNGCIGGEKIGISGIDVVVD
jgi:hypothetical protein